VYTHTRTVAAPLPVRDSETVEKLSSEQTTSSRPDRNKVQMKLALLSNVFLISYIIYILLFIYCGHEPMSDRCFQERRQYTAQTFVHGTDFIYLLIYLLFNYSVGNSEYT
jgi:uncharacterized membrane protein (DUF106 family)